MPVDILARKAAPKKVPIVLSEEPDDNFSVILAPNAYSFMEQIDWAERLRGSGLFDLKENDTPTKDQISLAYQWSSGVISGFENLTTGGREAKVEDILESDPELFMAIFMAVAEGISVKKKSETISNSISTPMDNGANVQTSTLQ